MENALTISNAQTLVGSGIRVDLDGTVPVSALVATIFPWLLAIVALVVFIVGMRKRSDGASRDCFGVLTFLAIAVLSVGGFACLWRIGSIFVQHSYPARYSLSCLLQSLGFILRDAAWSVVFSGLIFSFALMIRRRRKTTDPVS